jgi:hypothetical protein
MGGEAQNVVRMNISVARDLKARMDAASASVNWSAVASAAFGAKLLELDGEKETATMDDVIARLKAADEADNNEQRQRGVAAGARWAKDYARPRQLRRLHKEAVDAQHGLDYELGVFDNGMNQGIAVGLYGVILGAEDFDRDDAKNFWQEAIGDDGHELMDDFDFASGFCDGALDVWEKVADKL